MSSKRMERKKAEKRAAILDAAEKLIARRGYWDMTLDQVAEEADVAKGTIYLYFKNKESMCAAVYARVMKDMNTAVKEKLSNVEGGANKIEAMLNTVVQYTVDNPRKHKVIKNTYGVDFKESRDKNIREMVRIDSEQIRMMRDNYVEAMAEGSVRPDLDPMMTVMFLRMALWTSGNPPAFQALVMNSNGVDPNEFMVNARDLLTYATHTDPKPWIGKKLPTIHTVRKKARKTQKKSSAN